MDKFYQRLAHALEETGKTHGAVSREASRLLGKDKPNLTLVRDAIDQMASGMRGENGIAVAKAIPCSYEWLMRGIGEPEFGTYKGPALSSEEDIEPYEYSSEPGRSSGKKPTRNDGCIIPEIDGFAGMGMADGALSSENDNGVEADAIKANWQFPKAWISALGIGDNGLYLIEAIGDSNSPDINSGDRLLVNTKDRTPSPPGFFALWDGLGVTIKRIEVVPNSEPLMVKIHSANTAYGTYERTLDEVNIIGRIRAGILRM